MSLCILGVEGFVVAGESREPDMDAIADNSARDFTARDFEAFITETMTRVTHYEFVIGQQEASNQASQPIAASAAQAERQRSADRKL